MTTEFDITLLEKPDTDALTKANVMDLFDMLKDTKAYPIEIENPNGGSSAMGFITTKAAESINYDYREISKEIGNILADMNLENDMGIYQILGLNVYLSR